MRFVGGLVALGFFVACSSDPAVTPTAGDDDDDPVTEAHFEKDVMPIIALNCALSACHGSKESPRGVHLTSVKEETYASLMLQSKLFPSVKLVEPGKPESSLVMVKMDNTPLDACKGKCGRSMPPSESSESTGDEAILSQHDRDVVRVWIQSGALND